MVVLSLKVSSPLKNAQNSHEMRQFSPPIEDEIVIDRLKSVVSLIGAVVGLWRTETFDAATKLLKNPERQPIHRRSSKQSLGIVIYVTQYRANLPGHGVHWRRTRSMRSNQGAIGGAVRAGRREVSTLQYRAC
jgi:hypothetical protein